MITKNKCTTLSTSNTKTLICDETTLNNQWGGAMRAREKVVPTLTARIVRQPPVVFPQRAYDAYEDSEIGSTLKAYGGNVGGGSENVVVGTAYSLKVSQTGANGRPYKEESSFSLTRQDHHAVQRIARKLTPKECERLQGLPDGYTDYGSDSKRYKALGNGMAQPCADYVMSQVVKAIRKEESK